MAETKIDQNALGQLPGLVCELVKLHRKELFDVEEFESDGSCSECGDYWPCPTMEIVQRYKDPTGEDEVKLHD
jgi:hypothetical protein